MRAVCLSSLFFLLLLLLPSSSFNLGSRSLKAFSPKSRYAISASIVRMCAEPENNSPTSSPTSLDTDASNNVISEEKQRSLEEVRMQQQCNPLRTKVSD